MTSLANGLDLMPEQAALAAGPIIAAILQWLPPVQRCRLLTVNRAWRAAGNDPDTWRGLTLLQKRASLVAACNENNLALARKRTTLFGLTLDDARSKDNLALRAACAGGNLELVQWLATHFELLDPRILPPWYGRPVVPWLACIACENGHLAVVQWLTTHYGHTCIRRRIGRNSLPVDLLIAACENSQLAIAQWLAAHFKLTTNDARSSGNSAIQAACHNGDMAAVQWLITHFELSVEDIRMYGNLALRAACRNGHVHIAQWLTDYYQLTVDDVCCLDGRIPHVALYERHPEVIQWLVARFGLNIRDAIGHESYDFYVKYVQGPRLTSSVD